MKIPIMGQAGDFPSRLGDFGGVDFGQNKARLLPGVGQNLAPGIDDEGMAIGLTVPGMASALGGRDYEATGLNRPRSLQNMPMGFPGGAGKSGGNGQKIGPGFSQRPIKMGKAQIITNGKPEPAPGQIDGHCLIARLKRG